ncbi:MAG: ABC transporter ATP-binding protein [Deltaproteobacteria bacterium]|nr:ABC transporter ATP-binding protein [Deltaproteobacteria bacterium]
MEIIVRLYKTYAHPYIGYFILAAFFGLLTGSVGPSALYYFGDFIKILGMSPIDQTKFLQNSPWIVLVLAVLSAIGPFFNNIIVKFTSQKIIYNIRNQVFDHCLHLSHSQYGNSSVGKLVSRVTYDVNLVSGFLGILTDIMKSPFTIIGFFVVAFLRSWKITALSLVSLPLCFLVIKILGTYIKRYAVRLQERFGDINHSIQDFFHAIAMIKSFTLEKFIHNKFESQNRKFYRAEVKYSLVEALGTPTISLITGVYVSFLISLIFVYKLLGDTSVTHDVVGLMTVGGALFAVRSPANKIHTFYVSMQSAIAAGQRLFEFLDKPAVVVNASNAKDLSSFQKEIWFSKVQFRYEQEPILSDINLSIQRGKRVAFVGISGAGKSTIVNLLCRFYDVNEGSIYIDGVDVRQLTLQSLRRHISLVSQETFLLNDTILENIRLGKYDATQEEIELAAQAAYADEFIKKCPQGYETNIGDRGTKLSGGQRQRISIARALLKNAPIVIFDEATSSLDVESESIVQKALERLMLGRTVIIIAHRLSTIADVDCIHVLDQGRIVESGTPPDLLAKKGAFYHLYHLNQTGFASISSPLVGRGLGGL